MISKTSITILVGPTITAKTTLFKTSSSKVGPVPINSAINLKTLKLKMTAMSLKISRFTILRLKKTRLWLRSRGVV